jgi:hypothetical protein
MGDAIRAGRRVVSACSRFRWLPKWKTQNVISMPGAEWLSDPEARSARRQPADGYGRSQILMNLMFNGIEAMQAAANQRLEVTNEALRIENVERKGGEQALRELVE